MLILLEGNCQEIAVLFFDDGGKTSSIIGSVAGRDGMPVVPGVPDAHVIHDQLQHDDSMRSRNGTIFRLIRPQYKRAILANATGGGCFMVDRFQFDHTNFDSSAIFKLDTSLDGPSLDPVGMATGQTRETHDQQAGYTQAVNRGVVQSHLKFSQRLTISPVCQMSCETGIDDRADRPHAAISHGKRDETSMKTAK